MVGYDTAHKVGVGVPEGGHEFGKRLFIELTNRAEHALLGFIRGSKRGLVHPCHLVQTNNAVHCHEEREKEIKQLD